MPLKTWGSERELFQRVVLLRESAGELGLGGQEDFEAARIKNRGVANDVEGRSPLGAGFRKGKGSVRKIESGQGVLAGEFGSRRFPVKAAGDHEMKHQPDAIIQPDGDAFADASECCDSGAFRSGERRIYGA